MQIKKPRKGEADFKNHKKMTPMSIDTASIAMSTQNKNSFLLKKSLIFTTIKKQIEN